MGARDLQVKAARQVYELLSEQLKQAEHRVAGKVGITAWREAHPLRAETYDLGMAQSKFLAEREETRRAA